MNCIFCEIANKKIPSKVIYEDDVVISYLDINPDSNGHTLIIPKKHYTDMYDIDSDTLMYIFNIARDVGKVLYDKLHCDGISFCQNNGIAQDVKHFHLHIIPKYKVENKMDIKDVYEILRKETN